MSLIFNVMCSYNAKEYDQSEGRTGGPRVGGFYRGKTES